MRRRRMTQARGGGGSTAVAGASGATAIAMRGAAGALGSRARTATRGGSAIIAQLAQSSQGIVPASDGSGVGGASACP